MMKGLLCFALACLVLGASAVTQSATLVPSPTTVDSDSFAMVPTITFTSGDFGCAEAFVVTDVTVEVTFDKTSGSCASPGVSDSFHDEISISIGSSSGQNIVLVAPGDYFGDNDISPGVTVTFDQSAASTISGVPVSGTVAPASGNLDLLAGASGAAITYTLTAGDDAGGDPLCMFSWAVSVDAICTAGMAGDPHLFGFDGSFEDIQLAPGVVANVVSDIDLQVNVEMTQFASISQLFTSFMGSMSFQTVSGDTIVFDAMSGESGVRVIVNGETTLSSEFPSAVAGASFSITRDDVARNVPLPVDHSMNKVAQSFTVEFEHYSFGVFVVDSDFSSVVEHVRFLDFTMALHGSGHTPTGLLGRTVHAGEERSVAPSLEDFIVSDGILGNDFVLNKFNH